MSTNDPHHPFTGWCDHRELGERDDVCECGNALKRDWERDRGWCFECEADAAACDEADAQRKYPEEYETTDDLDEDIEW